MRDSGIKAPKKNLLTFQNSFLLAQNLFLKENRMKQVLLGPSGLRVSELCLGTMTFGTAWGFGVDYAGSKSLLHCFLDAGGNFVDTANLYTEGMSEAYLGRLMKQSGLRKDLVLASKFSLKTSQWSPNTAGNHKKNMVQSVDESLKRLQTDYLDILYLHAWDFTIRPEELMYNLEQLVRSGKVLHTALSDVPAWVFSACMTLASERHYSRPVALQGEYSLLNRDMERDMIPAACHFQTPVLAWGVLAGGAFSGKYLRGESGRVPEHSLRRSEKAERLARLLDKQSKALGVPAVALALRWAMDGPGKVIPIVGARNAEQLKESMQACAIDALDKEFLKELQDASAITYGFPHEFLLGDQARQFQLGERPEELLPLPQAYRNIKDKPWQG